MSTRWNHWGALALALGGLTVATWAAAEDRAASSAAAPPSESSVGPASEVAAASGSRSLTLAWSTTYASRYSFQGLDYSDGRPVLQPSLSASVRGFTAGVWGNADQTRREFNEVDATLQRDFTRGRMSGALGYAYLRYPNRVDWAPTQEAWLDLALDATLAPSLSVHWDTDAGSGRYWTLGVGHEFATSRGTLGLSAKAYAHEHYYGMSGVPAMETGVSFSRDLGSLTIQPSLAHQWAWENGDFREEFAVKPGWVFGLNVAPK